MQLLPRKQRAVRDGGTCGLGRKRGKLLLDGGVGHARREAVEDDAHGHPCSSEPRLPMNDRRIGVDEAVLRHGSHGRTEDVSAHCAEDSLRTGAVAGHESPGERAFRPVHRLEIRLAVRTPPDVRDCRTGTVPGRGQPGTSSSAAGNGQRRRLSTRGKAVTPRHASPALTRDLRSRYAVIPMLV